MKAAFVSRFSPNDPLSALSVGERPEPSAPAGWSTVSIRAAALNGHDLWALRGVGLSPESLPRILGSDGAGVDEHGNDVVIYPEISAPGYGPPRGTQPVHGTLLSERVDGTLAERVVVPTANLLPKPSRLSFAQAAALPTAWLTAYRMLFSLSNTNPGDVVLVQGATGGVSSALITLGSAAGLRMWVTGRSDEKRARALEFGAERTFASGERLPERVAAVMETVGGATWDHSMKVLRPGGTLVVAGATAGHLPPLELRRVFSLGLRIIGTRTGTLDELKGLLAFCDSASLVPAIDSEYRLVDTADALRHLHSGDAVGKIVIIP